jgi:hypothetical protein
MSSSLRLRRHDGECLVHHGIEQGGFTDVRIPDDGYEARFESFGLISQGIILYILLDQRLR